MNAVTLRHCRTSTHCQTKCDHQPFTLQSGLNLTSGHDSFPQLQLPSSYFIRLWILIITVMKSRFNGSFSATNEADILIWTFLIFIMAPRQIHGWWHHRDSLLVHEDKQRYKRLSWLSIKGLRCLYASLRFLLSPVNITDDTSGPKSLVWTKINCALHLHLSNSRLWGFQYS